MAPAYPAPTNPDRRQQQAQAATPLRHGKLPSGPVTGKRGGSGGLGPRASTAGERRRRPQASKR